MVGALMDAGCVAGLESIGVWLDCWNARARWMRFSCMAEGLCAVMLAVSECS